MRWGTRDGYNRAEIARGSPEGRSLDPESLRQPDTPLWAFKHDFDHADFPTPSPLPKQSPKFLAIGPPISPNYTLNPSLEHKDIGVLQSLTPNYACQPPRSGFGLRCCRWF